MFWNTKGVFVHWTLKIKQQGILFQPLSNLDGKISYKSPGLQKEKSFFTKITIHIFHLMYLSIQVFCQWRHRDLGNELLEHPLYFPDLAPSEFHLFPKLKLFLTSQQFLSDQEVISAVDGYFLDPRKPHQGQDSGVATSLE